MKITITEQDLKHVLSAAELSLISATSDKKTLGPALSERAEALMRRLPVTLASILNSIDLEGFQVSQFEIEIELAGKPFGIGVSGKGAVTFSRSVQ